MYNACVWTLEIFRKIVLKYGMRMMIAEPSRLLAALLCGDFCYNEGAFFWMAARIQPGMTQGRKYTYYMTHKGKKY